MTPGEFREFAKAMSEFGLSYVKIGRVEMRRDSELKDEKTLYSKQMERSVEPSTPMQGLAAQLASNMYSGHQPEVDPIQHKTEALTSLLKLDDRALVDQLFPDHTEQDESA